MGTTKTNKHKMKRAVAPISPGTHTLTAYLVVKNAGNAIQFCKKGFGAKDLSSWLSQTG